MHTDQGIKQSQAPPSLAVSGRQLADRPPRAIVVDIHTQVTAGVRHPDPDRSLTMTQGVRDQLAS